MTSSSPPEGRRPPWLLFCCDKFPCDFIHQPAKVCILQSRLRTRRCVGFWTSSHPAFKFPHSYEYLQTLGCNRTFRGWGTCRSMRRQLHRCRFRFCHTSFSSFWLLHPFLRHRYGADYQAGILSAASRAEMADVEQMKKIIPFVTCEITFGQICLRVDVWYQCIESRLILSNKQPKATLWVLNTCLSVGLRPFEMTLITASLSSKTHNIALDTENLTFESTLSMWNNSELSCLVGALVWFFFRVLDTTQTMPISRALRFGRGLAKFEYLSVVHFGDQLLRLFAELIGLPRLVSSPARKVPHSGGSRTAESTFWLCPCDLCPVVGLQKWACQELCSQPALSPSFSVTLRFPGWVPRWSFVLVSLILLTTVRIRFEYNTWQSWG